MNWLMFCPTWDLAASHACRNQLPHPIRCFHCVFLPTAVEVDCLQRCAFYVTVRSYCAATLLLSACIYGCTKAGLNMSGIATWLQFTMHCAK